jgi:acid phosphatase
MIEFPPNCHAGDLTVLGQNQQHRLGSFFRDYLVKDVKFLPEAFDPGLIYVRTDRDQRVYDSATCFIHGLWPPQNPNEILTMETGGTGQDFFMPSCSEIGKLWNEFHDTQVYKDFVKLVDQEAKPFGDFFHTSGSGSCDLAIARYCNEGEFLPEPANYTHMIDMCRRVIGLGAFGSYNLSRGVAGSPGMREIFRKMNASLVGNTTQKFFLFSAHDMSVAAILTNIGYVPPETQVPTYASWIDFEVWEDAKEKALMLRIVYNGEVLKINGETTYMKLDHFIDVMMPLTDHCHDLP